MSKQIDLIYDLIDQAAMIYYDNLKVDYLEALLLVNKGLNYDEFDSRLTDEAIIKLEEIYHIFSLESFYNEEVRLALELLIIKAFKHINFPLNIMTPDFINYLLVIIVNSLFKNEDITILDTALGTANMLQAISNNYVNHAKIIGIENNEMLTKIASASADLQNNELIIYFQDALNTVLDVVDLVVGDLDAYDVEENKLSKNHLYQQGVRYFPYLMITERLNNLRPGGYFIYLIENDFFQKENSDFFKQYLEKEASLLGLIILPKEIFLDGYLGKSILIGKKEVLHSYELMILDIPNLSEDSIKRSVNKLKALIEKI